MGARYTLIVALLVLAGCTLPTGTTNTQQEEETIGGPPQVSIAAPRPNAAYASGVPVNVQASVTNAGDNIDRVEISVDNVVIAALQDPNSAGLPVFSITETWSTQEIGEYNIAVVAYRTDGSSSQPATVNVNVVDPQGAADDPTPEAAPDDADAGDNNTDTEGEEEPPAEQAQPTDPPEPTTPPEPSDTPEPTEPPVPMAIFNSGINVRSGPGTNFNPPIGNFAANQSTEILGLNLTGSWLKVRFANREGWVFARLVEIEGDITDLPREAGPPTPVPTPIPTNTPIPFTATPSVTNNLVPVNPFINPPVPNCAEDFTVGVTIRNDGSGSLSTGTSQIRIVRALDGTLIASSENALVPVELGPGGMHQVQFTFNLNVFVGEDHRVEFVADVNNDVTETIEDDNTITVDYPMPANCP